MDGINFRDLHVTCANLNTGGLFSLVLPYTMFNKFIFEFHPARENYEFGEFVIDTPDNRINYHLIDKPDSKGFYIIPTVLDMLNPVPVNIHIAEGPFDILSIYYNINNCNKFQNIYCSCGGKGFSAAIEFILKELGLINYNIHIYPDKDQKQYEINNVIDRCIKLSCSLFEHHNTFNGEKDYGVSSDRIIDTVFKRL